MDPRDKIFVLIFTTLVAFMALSILMILAS